MIHRRGLLAAGGALIGAPALAQGEYWPEGSSWETRDPAQAGFDAAALKAALDEAMADGSTSLMVLRGGRITAEAYGAAGGREVAREIASGAKSMTSVLVGAAIDAGKMKGVEQPAADFVPQWRDTPKAAVTLRHLLTMTSGMRDAGLLVRNQQGDQFAINAGAPLVNPPGTDWNYANCIYHLLFHIVGRAAGERYEDFARRALVGPLGMEQLRWVTNQGQGASGPVTNYYSAACSARDYARFGLMALRGGRWGGRRIVSEAYLKAATSPSQALNPAYGYLWWENAQPGVPAAGTGAARLQFEGSPRDAFAALGAGGQAAMVVPSLDLVVVRQGTAPAGAAAPARLLARVCGAVRRA